MPASMFSQIFIGPLYTGIASSFAPDDSNENFDCDLNRDDASDDASDDFSNDGDVNNDDTFVTINNRNITTYINNIMTTMIMIIQ